MSISSTAFLLFLAVSVTAYYLMPKGCRYLVLLAASAYFYLACGVRAAGYLLVTILTTYGAALWMGRMHRDERERLARADGDKAALRRQGKRRRCGVLAAILVFNFATLILFKYSSSWLMDLGRLLGAAGIAVSFRPLELLLPLGISFYIFQTSGYLIDVYRGRAEPEKNLLKYTLFVSWFPQMIQGPINRFDKLHPQLVDGNDFSADNLKYGIQLMMWGMLKKVFIADPLAGAVAEVYNNFGSYPGMASLLGAVLYCIQLYCDFSGGTDLVRGASQLFGVEMAENFRRPYFARTLDDFWRRWHISLGEWMKDYLFYPMALSGPMSRLGRWARKRLGPFFGKALAPSLATLVVFLAVGVWQGPGLQNIAYGLWNGGLMSLAMLCAPALHKSRERLRISGEEGWFIAFQRLRTCLLVVIGRYFSRGNGLYSALRMLKHTAVRFGAPSLGVFTCFGLTGLDWLKLGMGGAVLLTVSILQERGVPIRKTLEKKHWAVQFAVMFLGALLLIAFVYLNSDYVNIQYVYENI